jgi:hypothetical protein
MTTHFILAKGQKFAVLDTEVRDVARGWIPLPLARELQRVGVPLSATTAYPLTLEIRQTGRPATTHQFYARRNDATGVARLSGRC